MFSDNLNKKIRDYYEKYYKSCGLRDFKLRAEKKINEEQTEEKRLLRIEGKLGLQNMQGKNCFIMGAGTGGLAVVLKEKYGVNVFGCEPDTIALNILKQKLKEKGIDNVGFTADFGESLSSFKDNQFDLVYCYTVLEHVSDVEKCLAEMIRITKPKGLIYLNTPNYGFPEERHYKIKWLFPPAYLPRAFSYFYLILRGKPIKFFKSLNLVTKKRLNKTLLKLSRDDNFETTFLSPANSGTQELLLKKFA
ncbi:MAG: class I SAM-dependent methyltransferase [bacterium]|nr:class I SAM-dependent methyltransferase [bacterium]